MTSDTANSPDGPDTPEVPDAIERFDPSAAQGGMLAAEHWARYRWATQFAAGRRVLDAACGTGYGSRLIAANGATEVVGIDVDAPTIEAARQDAPSGVRFEAGDVSALPFGDASFDLVVSFETIEHIEDPAGAMDEFARVLAPDGLLVISTPNRDVYTPGNPHHLHELSWDEFTSALGARFAHVTAYRQHTWVASAILDDTEFSAEPGTRLEGEVRKLDSRRPGEETYTLAVAGNQPPAPARSAVALNEPVELRQWERSWADHAAALTDQNVVLSAQAEHLSAQAHAIQTGTERSDALEREIKRLREGLLDAERELARIPDLGTDLELAMETLGVLHDIEAQRDDWIERYIGVVNSSYWKLTGPLRALVEWNRRRGQR